MSAVSMDYLQPPEPDPERAPDDTSEPVGLAVDDLLQYQQPPPSMLRPAHEWEGNASGGPRPWVSRPIGLAIAGFSLSLAGHLLTSTAFALMSPSDPTWITLALAAVGIVAGIVVSATALVRYRLGAVGGSRWAGAGLVLGVVWVLIALAFALPLISAPWADF